MLSQRDPDTGEILKPFEEIVANAASLDPTTKLAAVQSARNLLEADFYNTVDGFINSGIMPVLVECLDSDHNPALQFEAAATLGFIASGCSSYTSAVVHAGAVPIFIRLIKSEHQNVCKEIVAALGHIINDGSHCRDSMIAAGVVSALCSIIKPNTPVPVLQNVAWTMRNLCRYKDPLPVEIIIDVLHALLALMQHTDTGILVDTIKALAFLTEGDTNQIQMILDSGILTPLIPLLGNPDVKVHAEVLRAIGNISSGTEEHTQVVLDHSALSYVPALLNNSEKNINKDAFFFLSNVAAGNHDQAQAVIDAGLIPLITHYMSKGDFDSKREAARVISNLMVTGQPKQLSFAVNNDILTPFCNLLEIKDLELITEMLEGMINLLKNVGEELDKVCNFIENCSGVEKIEKLQNNDNVDIRKLASEIIKNYFT